MRNQVINCQTGEISYVEVADVEEEIIESVPETIEEKVVELAEKVKQLEDIVL